MIYTSDILYDVRVHRCSLSVIRGINEESVCGTVASLLLLMPCNAQWPSLCVLSSAGTHLGSLVNER